MVEFKLHRVPRDGPPEAVYLSQINIDLDLTKNPRVRNMFTDPHAGKEIDTFLQAHRIRIENKYQREGRVTRIEIKGSPEGLAKFHEAYLTDDKPSGVYDLEYR